MKIGTPQLPLTRCHYVAGTLDWQWTGDPDHKEQGFSSVIEAKRHARSLPGVAFVVGYTPKDPYMLHPRSIATYRSPGESTRFADKPGYDI